MTVVLSIHQNYTGPDYANTNVWVVPGDNPYGASGQPILNGNNWIWAAVSNAGTDRADGVNIMYWGIQPGRQVPYWGDAAPYRLNFVSSVVIPSGGIVIKDYAKVPWVPTVSGHTCIMAVVTSAVDPAPPMGASDPVLIGDRHVAQRNVEVGLIASSVRRFAHVFGVPTERREELVITARRVPVTEFAPSFGYTGVAHTPPEIAAGDIEQVYFQRPEDLGTNAQLGASTRLTPDIGDQLALVVQLSGKQAPGSAVVYRIETQRRHQILSGILVMALVQKH